MGKTDKGKYISSLLLENNILRIMNRSNFAQLQHPQIGPGTLKSGIKFTSYERITIQLFLEKVSSLENV